MEKKGKIQLTLTFNYDIEDEGLGDKEIIIEITALRIGIEKRILNEFIQDEKMNSTKFSLHKIA